MYSIFYPFLGDCLVQKGRHVNTLFAPKERMEGNSFNISLIEVSGEARSTVRAACSH